MDAMYVSVYAHTHTHATQFANKKYANGNIYA